MTDGSGTRPIRPFPPYPVDIASQRRRQAGLALSPPRVKNLVAAGLVTAESDERVSGAVVAVVVEADSTVYDADRVQAPTAPNPCLRLYCHGNMIVLCCGVVQVRIRRESAGSTPPSGRTIGVRTQGERNVGLSDHEQTQFDDIVSRIAADGGLRTGKAEMMARARKRARMTIPPTAIVVGVVVMLVGISVGMWLSVVGLLITAAGMWAVVTWASAAARRVAQSGENPLSKVKARLPQPPQRRGRDEDIF